MAFGTPSSRSLRQARIAPLTTSEDKQPSAIKVEIVDASSDAERLKRLEAEVDAETDGTPKAVDAEGDAD